MNFLRDYIGVKELAQAVMAFGEGAAPLSFNLSSLKPASKQEVLDLFTSHFGLIYNWDPVFGRKKKVEEYYCAEFSEELRGYSPRRSIDVIRDAIYNLGDE